MNRSIKIVAASGLVLAVASAALAADPTSLSEVAATGSGYLSQAQTVALGFAILGMGWAGYRVVRKFIK